MTQWKHIGLCLILTLVPALPARAEVGHSCVGSQSCTDGYVPCGVDQYHCLRCCPPNQGGSPGAAPAAPTVPFDPGTYFLQKMNGAVQEEFQNQMKKGIEKLLTPEDPAEVERRRQEEERLQQEAAKKLKEKNDALDADAAGLLDTGKPRKTSASDEDLLAPAGAKKPVPIVHLKPTEQPEPKPSPKEKARESAECIDDPNQVTCMTYVCGATEKTPVCCPKDHPYLNSCDCRCYPSSEDITDCSQYSACQYTWRPNP